jgi:hypothetical protein
VIVCCFPFEASWQITTLASGDFVLAACIAIPVASSRALSPEEHAPAVNMQAEQMK